MDNILIKYYSNGVYEGKFIDDKKDGEGIMTYTNGDIYSGNWINDKKNGFGKMIYLNGDIYSGNWNNNKRYGMGKIIYANGDIYYGNWKDNKKNGDGVITINGIEYSGTWINNVQQKIPTITSVKIKNQEDFSTCWAHAISRTFVRTLQILGVCKSEYVEEFYLLFFTILVEHKDCDEGGEFQDMIYLFNYIKNNYETKIFDIKKSDIICNYEICSPEDKNKPILNLPEFLRNEFIGKLKYLFDEDILFLAIYEYDVNINGDNKPTKAIKTMLDYRLQPYIGIKINEYLNKIISKQNNQRSDIYPSVQLINNIQEHHDYKCVNGEYSHAINLRNWKKTGIEFKNSWGINTGLKGNFSVPDLKYLICKKTDFKINTMIQFRVFMFDYNKLNKQFKDIVDNNIRKYQPTINSFLETKENNNYIGSLNEYGFLNGECELKYNNTYSYIGNLINGIRYGKGIYNYSNGDIYDGEWVNGEQQGNGVMNYHNGITYNGEWVKGKKHGKGFFSDDNRNSYNGDWVNDLANGEGEMKYNNGDVYNGDWVEGKKHGKGVMNYSNGDVYVGDWVEDLKYGEGVMHYSNGDVYNGNWDNFQHRKGIMKYANGDIYDGDWFLDAKWGKGIMNYKDTRDIYDGDWYDNEYHGKGIYRDVNGNSYEGDWVNGKKNGMGIYRLKDGTSREEEWVDGNIIKYSDYKLKYLKYKKKYLELKSNTK
jgi:hypothetical protein